MSDKIIEVEGIFKNVILRRNTRIKRLSIKINPYSGVVVSIPKLMSDKIAILFVQSKQKWINKHLKQIFLQDRLLDKTEITLADNSKIRFHQIEHNISSIKEENDILLVEIPISWSNKKIEAFKKEVIVKRLKIKAQSFLKKRVNYLSEKHQLHFNKLTLRNQKTLWGSCSFQNNISLNIELMRLPIHLVDYVIIHELCHTVHKNHSQVFWDFMYNKMGNSVYACNAELRTHVLQL